MNPVEALPWHALINKNNARVRAKYLKKALTKEKWSDIIPLVNVANPERSGYAKL